MLKTFEAVVNNRRAIRKFDINFDFDLSIVRKCLELSTLAPNSSNMQLWEFHCVSSPDILNTMKDCCMGQNAAKTANALVAFVTSPHKWKERSEMNAKIIRDAFSGKQNVPQNVYDYYEIDMPRLYAGVDLNEYKGLVGEQANLVRTQDVRVIMNKSVALAAMTFMYAMSEAGYDTCPMEGFEEDKVKKTLNLPPESEVSMVVSCGKRRPEGVYGERKRVDYSDVIFEY